MSDKDDLPEIPSWEELGLTPEEVEELEREARGEPPSATPGPAKADARAQGPGTGAAPDPERETGAGRPGAPKAARPAAAKRERAPREKTPRPPVSPLTWVTPLALVVVAFLSSTSRIAPPPAAANAPAAEFSAARARAHLERIARRAHPPGSPEHAAVRAYLLDELADLGLEPEVQTATSVTGRGSFARAATVRNVVARAAGSSPGDAVLLTAHYDGRGIATAAGDDGVGVSVILEAVRALRAGPAPRNDVIVLFTDAEELGLLGARAFVDEHPWLDDVALVVSVEMRGGGGPALMFETGPDNGWVISTFADAVSRPAANALSYEIYQRLPNDTDFTPFRVAGKQGLNFAAIGRAAVYHQAYDTPANVSDRTLQHHGDQVLAVLRSFGAADLGAVNAPDVSYVTVPFLGMLVYGRLWVWLFGALTLGAWLLAAWWARKGGGRIAGLAAGLGGAVATLAGSAAVGLGLFAWRRGAHPEFGALHGSAFHSEGWYVLALAAAALAIGSAQYGLARRWSTASELAVGALLLPVGAAVAATFMIPLGAANLQWPALAASLAALAAARTRSSARLDVARWPILLAGAAVAVAFLVPLIELLWLSMSLAAAAALGALLGLLVVLVLPALEPSRAPYSWALPVACFVAGVAALGVGVAQAAPSPDRPAPSTLIYTLDRGTDMARWATDGTRSTVHPGVAWAFERIEGFGDPAPLAGFGIGEAAYRKAPAPAADFPAPEVTVAFDSGAAGPVARVSVRSAIGAEAIAVVLPEAGPDLRAINGEPLPNADRVDYADHWGAPEGSVTFDFLTGFRDDTLSVAIVEHMFRPDELVGEEPFRRPPGLAPDVTRLSDRALVRTPVRIALETGAVLLAGAPVAAGASPGPAAGAQDGAASAGADSAAVEQDSAAVEPDSAAVEPADGSP
ncbi:MAG TPA: M28 family peptidase [Longimicrobiales bacterium]|nr:M28 family peptidase [Longimicrobiales bacterium]